MKAERAYLQVVSVTVILLLGGIMTLNHSVDPYSIFKSHEDREGRGHNPGAYQRVRLLKAYEIRHVKPDSVILGSSRSHLGIRPSHPLWKARAKRPYNVGFDGATTKEMYHYLIHAHSVNPLQLVLLGIDTWHLMGGPGWSRPDFDPSILARGQGFLDGARHAAANFRLLTSVDTLIGSASLLSRSSEETIAYLAPDGQRVGEIFFRKLGISFTTQSPRHYFDETDRMEVRYRLEHLLPSRMPKVYPPQVHRTDTLSSFDYIERIIAFCREKDIELKIFISPSHAHQIQLSKVLGQWPTIEKYKRQLVEALARDETSHPGRPVFPVYDFSSYTPVTTERLRAPASQEEMDYYWDSSHYKQGVGDMVLSCILGDAERGDCSLGSRLTRQNIDSVLSRFLRDEEEYERRNPESVKLIRQYIEDFKREHGIEA